jgi:hypothetical protein
MTIDMPTEYLIGLLHELQKLPCCCTCGPLLHRGISGVMVVIQTRHRCS